MAMEFGKLLTQCREKAELSKTELGGKLKVSPGYIMNLESGRRKPPTFERCHAIVKILKLNNDQAKALYQAAISERTPKDNKKFNEYLRVKAKEYPAAVRKSKVDHLTQHPEIIEALGDPVAVKALLITHKNSQDIKEAIKILLETIPNLVPEKRQAILALCK